VSLNSDDEGEVLAPSPHSMTQRECSHISQTSA
jgi:hypothetical protein